MNMGFNLQLEQTQKLVMTPQLQQAIKILQFTTMELEQFIIAEIEVNPFLDINEDHSSEEKKLESSKKEIDWKEYSVQYDYHGREGSSYDTENDFNYESIVSEKITLQDHLLNQLNLTLLKNKHKRIAEFIINSLDENGYLTLGLEEIAKEFYQSVDTVKKILEVIQTFEPSGVAARDLKESLSIQLNHLDITCHLTYRIVNEFLQEVGANKYPFIAKKLCVSVEKVQEICDFIRTLEPKPGRKFSSDKNTYIIPDAVVKKINDEYVIMLNDYGSPRLIIRDDYKKILANSKNEDTLKYISDKLNSASWLIRSIEQRRQTIYKVIEVIVNKQKDFFEYGKKNLKSMTLKEVANEIEVHESTVSRATTGKYVETPVGIFELKYFFSSGVEGIDGEGVSSESVKSFIKDIISIENPKKPFSDSKIAELLTKKGMTISRRTVAKYRDDMLIPASSKRKRF